MFHPRTYVFFRCTVRCLVLTLWFLCCASVPAAAEVSHMHFLLSTQPFLHPLVSELLMRRLSFFHPKDCSPRAPQPALAGVKARKGTAVPYIRIAPGVKVRKGAAAPYFRIFYSVLSFIFTHTTFLFVMFAGRAYIYR